MSEREKAIRGLEAHANPKTCETCAGEDCPYFNTGNSYTGVTCSSFLAADALALLKEQEPRVMMKEEIVLCTDWVWCEYKSGYQGWYKMEEYVTDYGLIRWEDTTADIVDDYGFRWRAWTSRPKPEQVRETPWGGEQ